MLQDIIDTAKEKMKKSCDVYERDMMGLRAGRANPKLLDRIMVDYYGTPTPIPQIGNISSPEPRLLVIQPWDATTVKSIEKAILASDIGITPMSDGKVIRLVFPPLTEDRRKEMCKQVSRFGEDAKVAIRNIRRDANDKVKEMKKASEMTEDEAKASDKATQDLTDKYIKEVDAVAAAKEKDIMEI